MLEKLTPQPPDKIIELIGMYRADPRTEKVDLGVGVYKDEKGATPVMRAVKAAEKRLLESQTSKSYVGLLGDLDFNAAMRGLVLGDAVPAGRVAAAQAPGGTGAIRQLLELVKLANPGAKVWYSDPTWPNHPAMVRHVGLASATYRYFDSATCTVDFAAMMADLDGLSAGDVVILHGCCHNPTGANLDAAQWDQVTDLLNAKGAIPFIDFAYQGFGDGLDADAAAVRRMVTRVPQMLIAASCSKNFGLYRDRVGIAMAVAQDAATADLAKGALSSLNRLNFSFPPDHGAKVVEIILNDPELRADWQAELEEMRTRMLELRAGLAEALRRETNSDSFDFVAHHRGMFSRLGLSQEQVMKLREESGIYMVGDSRVNIAGLPADKLDALAKAIVRVAG
ncbi:aspartate/tyrosine/aromatic aminotransferase [Halovulum dunhuangense]|uniref:Aminotransferase n=1 Tax=Halovulum dunhuangense TaxID=1505036 RepID=A0A849KR25_9RHOB|nr:amino acid aminotransferase [Halovulum dunhuangense]NNU79319.1 aspartate/tyrosine/aromatic aminotransferase [Halovulum dunhuangense]